jgi:hypothetical protein
MSFPRFKTLDEVPEPFRHLYRFDAAQAEAVADAVQGSEVAGLKDKNRELLRSIADLKTRYADIDPEEVKNLKTIGAKAEELDARLVAATRERADAEAKYLKRTARLHDATRDGAIVAALAKHGATPELLRPYLSQFVSVTEDEDGGMSIAVKDASGNVRFKNGAGDRLDVADFVAELREQPAFAPAFNVTPPSGGGARQGTPPAGARRMGVPDSRTMSANLDDIASGKLVIDAD